MLLALCLQGWPIDSHSQTPRVFCGLGPPPGSPKYADHEREQDQQRTALGYVLVCDENLRRFDFAPKARPLKQFSSRLAFKLVALEKTPFSRFELLGGISEIESDEGIVALNRVFRSAAGAVIALREWDMSVGGGCSFPMRSDLFTERVHDNPAQLMVYQSPSGQAVSLLYWTEGRREYELSVDANVKQVALSPGLLQLAESLPKSIPAKTKEPSMPAPRFPRPWLPAMPPMSPPSVPK